MNNVTWMWVVRCGDNKRRERRVWKKHWKLDRYWKKNLIESRGISRIDKNIEELE